jgi:hypothetical protein
MRERVAHRAVYLRHAAQGIGILHARIVLQMRSANLALAQKLSEGDGHLLLPAMRACGVKALVEGGGRPAQGFQRHRARDICGADEPRGAQERERTDRRQGLRSVQEREPLFRLQLERPEARAPERLGAREALALVK